MTKPLPLPFENPLPSSLSGGGIMGEAIRSRRWQDTSLGAAYTWPQSLRSALSICLHSAFPVAVYWGNDLAMLYNDACISILGDKHPSSLGKPAPDVWPELWEGLAPQLHKALRGEPGSLNGLRLRHGGAEERCVDFTFTPLYGEGGKVEGVFSTVTEISRRVTGKGHTAFFHNASPEAALQNIYRLFDEVPFAVAVLKGEDLVIEFANNYTLNIWQCTREEALGKPLFGLRPETRAGAEPLHRAVYRNGGRVVANEVPVEVITNGSLETRYFNSILDPLFEDGKVTGQLATTVEVTESVLARKRIEESEGRFRSLANAMPQVVWIAERNGEVTYYNDQVLQFDGVKKQPDGNWSWQGMLHPDDVAPTSNAWEDAVKAGTVYEKEQRVKMKNGDYRWHLSRGLPQKNGSGEVIKWYGTATDIHEQKLAEEELRLVKEQLELTFKNVPSGIYLYDKNGRILYLNGKGATQLGYASVEEVVAEKDVFRLRRKLDESFDIQNEKGEPLRLEQSAAALAFRTGGPTEVVARFVSKKGGKSFWMISSSAPLFDDAGNLTMVLTTSTDITAQKEAEERIRKSEQHLELLSDSIPSLIFYLDKEGRYQSCNKAFTQWFGVPRDEVIGQNAEDFVGEKAWQIIGPRLRRAYAGEAVEYESETPYRLGGKKWVHVVYTPHKDAAGNVQGVIVLVNDISQTKEAEQLLRASEEEFRNMANNIPQLAWMTDETGWIYWYNQRWYDYTGTTFEQMKGWGWQAVHHPDHLQGVTRRFREALAAGRFWEDTFPLRSKEGEYRWFLSRAYPLKNADGSFKGWFGSNTDVTEQREAQQRLQESESRFRSLANDTPAFMFTADAGTNIEFVNHRWLEFTGLTSPDGLGKAWAGVTHPDDVEPMYRIYTDAVKNNRPYRFEIRQKNTQGEYRWVLWNGIPRTAADGRFIGVVGIGIDVTEQKKIQEIIGESENRFRTLAETLPQMIWVSDSRGRNEYYSREWTDYCGIANVEEAWEYMIHPADKDASTEAYRKAFMEGLSFRTEVRLKNSAGEYRWHSSVAEPVRDEAGAVLKWVGAITDVHDQKTLTEKLEAEVAERTRELKRSNEDLQQFAHVASHDLKEPVRKVRTFSSRLAEELGNALPEKAKTYLAKIEAAADRMYAMIDGVLAYSSLTTMQQEKEPVDLNKTLLQIEGDLELLIQQKGAAVNYKNLPELNGLPVLLHQLFYNLVNNSLKFSKPGAAPIIQLEAADATPQEINEKALDANKAHVKIVLRDNGIGFGNNEAQRIFKTFTRLHSKDKYEGTGLGLALCKKIVERHEGCIEAEGREGEGAVFTVFLPKA